MFNIYDDSESRNEGACLRYMPESPNEGLWLRYSMNPRSRTSALTGTNLSPMLMLGQGLVHV